MREYPLRAAVVHQFGRGQGGKSTRGVEHIGRGGHVCIVLYWSDVEGEE